MRNRTSVCVLLSYTHAALHLILYIADIAFAFEVYKIFAPLQNKIARACIVILDNSS